MMKKAVSPLIATVLLIGFTVIIAAAIWMWYGRVVTEEYMKQGALTQIQTDCLSEIELQVVGVSVNGDILNIEIKNNGNKIFNGIRVLVNSGEEVLSVKEGFNPSEQKSVEVKTKISSVNTVTVMPMIVRQGVPGTCSDKKVIYDLTKV
ncbi:MAG: hypothetical protein PHF86_11345 [Candidatus Nanoarchaeia archaeon]|nr:hypothetical protein [Candidatus Nanoarchaeia archaeon]